MPTFRNSWVYFVTYILWYSVFVQISITMNSVKCYILACLYLISLVCWAEDGFVKIFHDYSPKQYHHAQFNKCEGKLILNKII